jgi:hypothetical protein
MKIVHWIALFGLGLGLGLGCGVAPDATALSGEQSAEAPPFVVQMNNTTAFDATYQQGSDWARIEVRYAPTTTLYRLTTSFGPTPLAYAGTAPADPTLLQLLTADPRHRDGFLELHDGEQEVRVVEGLLGELLAMGATEHPTPEAKGATLYASAYTAARVLGLVELRDPSEPATGEPPAGMPWPYPGYDSQELLPKELRAASGAQSFLNVHCCGPWNCKACEYNGQPCDDWCAAGDYCNAWGYGNCGSLCPGISCPHSNSSTLNAYTSGPCNTRPKSFCYWNYGPSLCH